MSAAMTWQQKAAALDALREIELHIRAPGDWYVHQGISIGGDGVLVGSYGNGETPELAIEDHWRIYCEELPHDRYIVIEGGIARRHVRWNGYMWQDLPIRKQVA